MDVVMPIYNLIEYSNSYTKTGSLWQYHKNVTRDPITDSGLGSRQK